MSLVKLDKKLIDEQIKSENEQAKTIKPEEISDEDTDLFQKIVAKQLEKDGADENTIKLFNEVDKKVVKDLYSNSFKNSLSNIADASLNRAQLLDDWHKQLAVSARDLGVIDRLDDKTLNSILKEQTFEPEHQKYSVWDGLKLGFRNQIEGVQYAGYATIAALKNDPSYYAKKAGGEMAKNADEAKWSDVLTDLFWMGNTGSETGGKMFAADLLFLPTNPIKVPIRMALGMATKASIKQGGKTLAKNIAKNLTKEAVEDAIKTGAKIELKGIGAKILEKDINKLAIEMTKKELTAAGEKAIKTLPTDLINKNKAKIVMDGLSSSYKIQNTLKNVTKGGLDLINVPLGLNTREVIKGMMGYGMPVLAGTSETFADVSSYFTQSGNKLAQLWAQHNVSEYEKQLAAEFKNMTGADPLADDFGSKDAWEAYRNFKIRNEGLGTILLGKKEGWGRFWNFFAESAVNMIGMSGSIKGMSAMSNIVGSKLNLTGVSDLTNKINEIKNSDRFNGKLELNPLKEDIEAFTKEIESIDFKKGGVETIKLMNRANDLVEAIFKKSSGLAINNPTLSSKITSLSDELFNKNFDKVDLPEKLKKISLVSREIIGELETSSDRFHLFRENAELKKIVNYFKELEDQNNFTSRLKLSIARNIANGSSADVKTYLGGISVAEAFANRNPFFSDYFLNKVLSSGEMAKNIATQKEMDMKNVQFLSELSVVKNGEISESGFMIKINKAVGDLVDSYFKGSDPKSNETIKNALINEGVIKTLEVYNSLSKTSIKSQLDFSEITREILGESFGEKVINTISGMKNTTVKEFLNSTDAKDKNVLTNLIKKSFESSDSIFHPKSEEMEKLLERYKSMSNEGREKLRALSESQKLAYDVFNRDLTAAKELKMRMNEIKSFGIIPPKNIGDSFLYNNKTYATENGAMNAFKKDLANTAAELNDSAMKDPNYVNNLITEKDIDNFISYNFKGLLDEEFALKKMLDKNLSNIQESVINIFEKNNQEIKPEEKIENIEEREDGSEPINTANTAVNRWISDLKQLSPLIGDKIITASNPKMSDLIRISKITNEMRANLVRVDSDKNLGEKIGYLAEEINTIKNKISKASSLKDAISSSIELINRIIPEIDAEIKSSGIKPGDIEILKARKERLNGSLEALVKSESFNVSRSEKAEIELFKESIENEIKLIDNNIKTIQGLINEASQAIESKKRDIKVSAGVETSMKDLQAKLSLYLKEQDKLLGERDSIVGDLYKNPLDKDSLSEMAKSSDSADVFYLNLQKKWNEVFGKDIEFPQSFLNKDSLNYKAIYNTLKQTTSGYKNPEFAGPRETAAVYISSSKGAKKGSNFDIDLTFGITQPRLVNGTKIIIPRVESMMSKIADEKGYKIVETAILQHGGRDIGLGELFSMDVKNSKLMEDYLKPENTPKITTAQEQAGFIVAQNISKKIHIGVGTNESEKLNSITSSPLSFKTDDGDAIFVGNKKLYRHEAEISQASTDGKINPAATNMIYQTIVKPIIDKSAAQGYTFLGSIDEEGGRLYFVPTQNKDVKKTFDSFYRDVLSIDPKTINTPLNPLKRIKNIASSEIHADEKSVNESYKNAGYERNLDDKGNVMFKGIFIDDEKHNSIKLDVNGESKNAVTTDGTTYMSRFMMDLINKEIGLKPDIVIKGSAFIPGEKSWVLKMMGKLITQEEANKSYFNKVEEIAGTREINQLEKKYDLFITKSTAKKLGLDFIEGSETDIPVQSFVVKRLDSTLKKEVSGAMQLFNSIPRIVSGNPEWTVKYDKAMDQILSMYNDEIKEFANVLQRINLDKPNAVEILKSSRLFKDISGDDFMSKAIDDIRANGGLKNINKNALFSHIMKTFNDRIIRTKLAGAEAHIIGIGDYKELADAVVKNFSNLGVNEKNFIILNRKYWKDKVYYNKNGLPEVFTYRYPVNKAANMTVPKVIWSDDPAVKDIVGDIGNKALLNMYDVFINKEGDFDIDKINIVSDKRIAGPFLDLIKSIPNEKELNFLVDIKDKDVMFHDLFFDAVNPTSDKLSTKVLPELREKISSKYDYFDFLYKIKSKHAKFSLEDTINHFLNGRQRIEAEKKLTQNSTTGMSFIERLYSLDGIDELASSNIKINSNVEKSATDYANTEIKKNISTKNIADDPVIIKFDQLNESFVKEIEPIKAMLFDHEKQEAFNSYDKIKIEVKKGTVGNIVYINDKYDVNKININYHKNVYEKLSNDIKAERNALSQGDKYNKEKWAAIREKAAGLDIVQARIDSLNTDISNLKRSRNDIIKKYENEAILKIKPDMAKGPYSEDLQRYILTKNWGAGVNNFGTSNKAFFLISPTIHKEYNALYNEKYLTIDLKESFGININENDTQKIKEYYNEFEKIKESTEDIDIISNAKIDLNQKISSIINEKILSSKTFDRPITLKDIRVSGKFSEVIEDVLYPKNWTNEKVKTRFTLHDLYDIKSLSDTIFKESYKDSSIIVKNINNNKKLISSIKAEIISLEKKRSKLSDYDKVKKINELIKSKKEEIKIKASEVIVGSYINSIGAARSLASVASASGKIEDISDGAIKDAERKAQQSESKAKELEKLSEEMSDKITQADINLEMLNQIKKINKVQGLIIERMFSQDGKQREYEKMAEDVKDITQRAFAKLFIKTADSVSRKDANNLLKEYDAMAEIKKNGIEINREISKMSEIEPSDIMSQVFETATKTYKNLSVGIAAGRAVIEAVNSGIILFTEAVKLLSKGSITDDAFKSRFKNIPDIKIPKPTEFKTGVYEDFIINNLGDSSPKNRSKILRDFNNSMSKIAGFVSGKFVNVIPSKMAQKYYDMQFRNALFKEVSKNDGSHRQKTYLLKDPSTLSWQDRQQYGASMRYLEEVARKETEKAFFNYDLNPLLVHKLESAIPFSNFMFSGFRLLKKHPRSILGANVLFASAINNYGDQVGYIMDDENGDPVRVDYGKRVKLPLLGMYAGASINFNRLLQFSPSDTRLGVAPIFSYLTGDSDWRVKKWLNGEMSGFELAAGAVSPSISQLAAGIIENDYQKRFSALSYLLTGLSSKSSAHAKVANDFYIKQDYQAVKDAPQSVKEHLFDQFNKKNKGVKFDDSTLDAMIAAKDLGLIGDPAKRNSFGMYEREDAFKDSIKTHGMMMALAANGTKDPLASEDYYKETGREVAEFTKWVVGDDFFKNSSDPEWMDKVEQFVKDGHLEKFKVVNPAYGEAMQHFYDNRKYYSDMREAQSMAYSTDSSEEEKMLGKAKLLALKYEMSGGGSSVDSKAYSLINGSVQFIVDENGMPEMTKERMAEIDYRGYFVANYEDAISKHMLYRDTRNFYLSMYSKAKAENNSKLKDYAWNMSEHNRVLMEQTYKELKEHHSEEAEIFNLKRLTEGKTPAEIEDKKLYVTQPISNYVEKRERNLNEFYNQIANDRVKFLETTDLKWSDLSNREQSVFMALNNGKTINQAKKELEVDKEFFKGLVDINSIKKTSNNIKLVKDLLYE